MSLELSLQVVLVIVDDSLVGDRDEDLLSFFVGEVMDAIEYVVVETNGPLQFEGASLTKILFFLSLVLTHC